MQIDKQCMNLKFMDKQYTLNPYEHPQNVSSANYCSDFLKTLKGCRNIQGFTLIRAVLLGS